MKVVRGNLWNEEGKADVILVTTNARINQHNRLIMGRGAALEAATRYPLLATELAERITPWNSRPYGVIILRPYANGIRLGAFQVKYDWREPADIKLIEYSAKILRVIANAHPDLRYALNYPGIGNGRLSEAEVEPKLEILPNNVFIYKKGD